MPLNKKPSVNSNNGASSGNLHLQNAATELAALLAGTSTNTNQASPAATKKLTNNQVRQNDNNTSSSSAIIKSSPNITNPSSTTSSKQQEWLDQLQKSKKQCIVQDGLKKIHYTFENEEQMVEEYAMNNANQLMVRKWRRRNRLGAIEQEWEYEIGGPADLERHNNFGKYGFAESIAEPQVFAEDTARHWQWRIRNLPYPSSVYDVSADVDKNHIKVRTTNKKYYKCLDLPGLARFGVKVRQDALSFTHNLNSLVIKYQKPAEVLSFEATFKAELAQVKDDLCRLKGAAGDGGVPGCPTHMIRFICVRPVDPVSDELLVNQWFDAAIQTHEKQSLLREVCQLLNSELHRRALHAPLQQQHPGTDGGAGAASDTTHAQHANKTDINEQVSHLIKLRQHDDTLVAIRRSGELYFLMGIQLEDNPHYALHLLQQFILALTECVLGKPPTLRGICANYHKIRHVIDEMFVPMGVGTGGVRYFDLYDIRFQCNRWFEKFKLHRPLSQ